MTTAYPIDVRSAVSETDILNPTSTQKYPLGMKIYVDDSMDGATVWKELQYVSAGAGLTKAHIYTIKNTGGTYVTATPASVSVSTLFGVALTNWTSGYYGFLQTGGTCNIISTGNTTQYNTMIMANSVSTGTDESTATESAKSIGVILSATQTSGSQTISVMLVPHRVTI